MSKEISAILWDNDGILVDTERLYFQAAQEAMRLVDFELSVEMFREFVLLEARGAWHLLQEQGVDESKIAELKKWRDQRYVELISNHSKPMDGIVTVLEQLKKQHRMAIVTSCKPEHFALIHRESNLLHHFEFALTREQYNESKPHPEPYLTALEKMQLPAEQCLVIEDSARGLRAADDAGIRCWVVPSELTAGSDFSRAEKILNSVSEIPKAILDS